MAEEKLTKEQLIERLIDCAAYDDTEMAHQRADDLLVEYIADDEIKAAYEDVSKWYA